ncbi:VanZ family protein [Corynebacterium lubricantis]|uniref:VanZ family protein n=1 Tax=Corynebacterium lubricantis TaxID=541095 RepID=UPI0014614D77|nr:VanZ family protein [Corynebacterium lubricantis]
MSQVNSTEQTDAQADTRAGRNLRPLAWVAAVITVAAIVCYTLLKGFVTLPFWNAEVHLRREIRPIPFIEFVDPNIWYGPLLNVGGNVLMFIPVGFLLVLIFQPKRPLRTALFVGLGASAFIEITQYIFALGYTDIDDLIFNTLGAVLGALLAKHLSLQGKYTLVGLIIAAGLIAVLPFAVVAYRYFT